MCIFDIEHETGANATLFVIPIVNIVQCEHVYGIQVRLACCRTTHNPVVRRVIKNSEVILNLG